MKHSSHCSIAVVAAGFLLSAVAAQDQPRGSSPGGHGSAATEAGRGANEIKPYDDVITKEAKTKAGLFLTHQVGDKLYYEISVSRLGKDMLWVWQLEKTQTGFGYAGSPLGDRAVRWELREETVLLRDVKYAIRADKEGAIQQAVESTNVAPIIKAFPVRAWGKDKAPVIDVTSLFTSDVPEFSARRALNANSLDSSRTFLEEVKAFPQNLEVTVMASYALAAATPATPTPPGPTTPRIDPSQSAVTALVHHSMLMLPEQPMKPRRKDERVGFFDVGFEDYTDDSQHQVEDVRYITRWRLEKKDPSADVSEPKQPITFYVGREVPEKWKPFVQSGIEYWQPAFEAAGFKSAIIGKLAPGPHEDPNWDEEDARISTIRWLPATIENAFGPHVHDPRSGEILEADIRIYHNVLKLIRDWYFVQASPNDPRAQTLPMPDELVGELLAYVVAHEVGHSLGFPHNMKASSSFTVKQLRDAEFTRKFGVEASIMDYGRFNYVAQPGDGAALIPKVGPYDFFAVEWGYREYKNEEEETKGLSALLAKQKEDPQLRFGDANPSEDPTRQTEDLGADPIEATELGLKNIQRVSGYLVEACCKPGEDYKLLENMYGQLVSQRTRELMHVTGMVGGVEQVNLYFGDADTVYRPISCDRQRQAVKFLVENAFRTPSELVNPAITMRLEAGGAAERILRGQTSAMRALMSEGRFKRMAEQVQQTKPGDPTYGPWELFANLRTGIWSELEQDRVTIDLYRRNLQRSHVNVLVGLLGSGAGSDLAAVSRHELEALREQISKKLEGADSLSKLHLEAVLAEITRAFDPANRPAPPAVP
jgi:hypothetical protein